MAGRVFWSLVGGFLLGVFTRSIVPLGPTFAAALALIGIAAAGTAIFDRQSKRIALPFAVAFLGAALGMVRMQSATLTGDPVLSAHLGEHVTLQGSVFAEPDVRQDSVRLSVAATNVSGMGTKVPVQGGVLAVLPAHVPVSYGDEVRVTGILKAPAAFDTGAGRQFDYPSYLAAQGIEYQLSSAHIEEVTPHTGNPLKAAAIWIKQIFLHGLQAALPEPAAGFAGGITVGDKRSIGPELSADFQKAGLIHMIVLSGYNITVVINAAAWLIRRAPVLASFRAMPLSVSGVIVLLFVLMSGGASSAARAGAMALIAVFARMSRRTFLASRALGAAAVAIVAWNPFTLCFDPGFQLSALATAGLIIFTPLVARHMLWLPVKWGLREIAASTVGTQLAVLPLLLYQNGMLSLYALPANLLTLPLVPYAMFASLVAGIIGLIPGPLATLAGLPAYLMLSYIIDMTQFIANLPFAGLSIPAFGAEWLIFAYAGLFAGARYLHAQKKTGH